MPSRTPARRSSRALNPTQRRQRRSELFRPLLESLEARTLLATITLSTVVDEFDGDTSSIANLISTPGGTGISLREAIIAANNTPSDDLINVPAGTYVLTIAGGSNTTGDLDILNAGSLTLQGVGVGSSKIDGGGSGGTLADRIFEIQGATVAFDSLTIQNGYVTTTHGAGFYNNGGTVTLTDVQLDSNFAQSTGGGDRHGGGFWSRSGSVTGTNVQLTNNQATRLAGTNNGVGGAFWLNEDAAVDITNVTMTGNQAVEGAGFYISNGNFGGSQVTLNNATIGNNVALVRGGGFRNGATDGVVTINGGTINQNIAENENGGGFYNNGKVVLNNVNITNNEVQGLDEGAIRDDSHGGGFFNNSIAAGLPSGIVEINGGSITGNIAYGHGGGFWNRGGNVTIQGTTLDPVEINNNQAGADSLGASRHGGGFWNTDEASTTLLNVTLDNNEVSENTSFQSTGVGAGYYSTSQSKVSLTNVSFTNHLANEGAAFYQDGVQALTTGTNVTISNNTARTRGGGFRNASTNGLVQLVNSTIENNTAENEYGGGFHNSGTVTLLNTDIASNHTLDLDNGNRRDGHGGGFYNGGGVVNLLSGSDVLNNDAYGYGGGFWNASGVVNASGSNIDGNSTIYFNSPRNGGGFWNQADGSVNLHDVTISNNFTGDDGVNGTRGAGGGFYNNGAFVTITGNSQIVNNRAEDGGGFYSDTGGSVVTITGTAANRIELQDNVGRVRGGAFRSTGNTVVNLAYVDIVSNEAETQRGGGFYADGAQVNGDHVRINGNITGSTGRTGDEQGGGFWLDGLGLVTLQSSEISGNYAYANGAGFYNTSATVELVDTKLTGNITYDHGGGFYADGDSVTRATRTNIDANLAGFENDGMTFSPTADRRGGGFWISSNASAHLVDSTVSGNEAHEYGGGVNMENDSLLTAHGTTFSDNVAGNHGGAIRTPGNSRVELTNSTISGNYAGFNRASNGGTPILDENDRVGAGIWVQDGNNVSVLNHVTISDNRSTSSSGAGLYRSNGSVTIENSIIFGNLANAETATPVSGDTQNVMTLVGANIIGAHVGSALVGNTGGRITTDPNLSPLADNGGPLTPSGNAPATHAITAGSVAVNAALGSLLEIDQRGAPRPNGAAADLGAFEIGVPDKITITAFNVPATVAESRTVEVSGAALTSSALPAVLSWEVLTSGGAVVATGSGANFSFTAPAIAGDLTLEDTLTVNLTAVDGTATDFRTTTIRVLNVDAMPTSATVGIAGSFTVTSSLDDGSPGTLRSAITQANALGTAGTVVIEIAAGINPTLSIAAAGDENGNANGDLDITRTNGAIHIVGQGSAATTISGGGVERVFDVHSTRTLYLKGLTVTGGVTVASDHGAGLRILGGTVVAQDVNIVGNDADRGTGNVGGGLYITNSGGNSPTFFMNGGTISNNKADSHGGGFYVSGTTPSSSTVILENVTLAANEASDEGTDRDGGAFYFTGNRNRLELTNVSIIDNSTKDDGGGFLLTGSDQVGTFTNVTIQRNSAADPAAGNQDNDGGGFLIEGQRHNLTFRSSLIGGAVDGNGDRVDGNWAESDAGGFHLRGRFNTVNLLDTTIQGNEAIGGTAGGFWTQNDTERVNISGDSKIIDNFATGNHAGGFRNDGVVTITGSATNPIEITGNQARDNTGRLDSIYANNTLSNNDRVGGGVFNTSNGVVELVDVLISNNIAYARGGGVFTNNGAITRISSSVPATFRSTISNNHAVRVQTNSDPQGDGGGLYVESAASRTELTDVLVTGNSASDEGAGFYIQSNLAVMTLLRTDITNNTALDNGGGFFNASNGSEVYLDTVLIDGNVSVSEHGGGFRNSGIVVGTNVTITNNEAGTDAAGDRVGGGFYNASGFATLTDTIIDNNTAFARGGGFFNNGGGVVTINSSNPTTFKSRITNNDVVGSAADGGGFFQETAGSTVRLTDVLLNDNIALDEGGGFYSQSDNAHVELTNVVIDGNFAEDTGGGFHNASGFSTVTLNNVQITNNISNTENGGGFRNAGPLSGQDVLIAGNIAGLADQIADNNNNRVGGGFLNQGSTAVIDLTRVRILNNDAHGRGGGFYSDGSSIVRLTDFVISGNTADQGTNEGQARGGGFWNSGNADVTLIRGEISENESFGHGGGFFQQDSGSSVTATNVTISNNLAGKDQQSGNFVNDRVGGGFWAISGGGRVSLNHVTVSGNRATRDNTDTGAGFRVDSGPSFQLTMENSIAYGNFRSADTATPIADDVENLAGSGFQLVGNNIIGVATQQALGGNVAGRSTIDPVLGALQNNGGFSRTHALNPTLSTSAIDQSLASSVTDDQRGLNRAVIQDLGAFETGVELTMTSDVTLIRSISGTSLEVRDTATNALLDSLLAASVASLTFNGSGNDDTLTVDFSNGNPIPVAGVFFNAGAETLGDNLVLQGASINTVTQTFTADGDGTVNIGGSLITYTSSEATDDNLVVQNRIYSYAASAETITLENGVALPEILSGWQLIDSSTTLAATAATTFANLTPGNGSSFATGDVLNITGSDAGGAFSTTFTITNASTTTLGDLVTALSAAFTASTASLNSGVIVLTANATGIATPDLSLAITSAPGNSGNTHAAPLGLFDVFEQGTTGVNESLIDSTLSDAVRFTNPTDSLTVQTTAGTGNDVIQVNSLAAPLGAGLVIDGKSTGDQSFINTNLSVDSVTATSSIIELGGNITTAATGVVTLNGLVRLATDVAINTAAGGGSDITVNGAIVAGVANADISFDAGAAGNINVTGGITAYYPAVGGVVVGEGEFFTSRLNNGSDNFEIISVETAPFPGLFSNSRGLGYVQVLPDGGTGTAGPPNGPPAIDYRVRITSADTYRLFLRTVGFDGGSDSIYASIVEVQDGAGGVPDWYRILTAGNSNFGSPPWETTGAVETTALSGTEVPMSWALTPGEYTIRIVNREDGVAVDALVLQPSSMAAPSGTGPAANGLSVGDVLVTNANNVSFGDAVIAGSFTQNTGVGTTTFDDAAIVSGAFDINNATVVATSGLVADTARIGYSSGATGSVSVTGGSVTIGNGDGNLDLATRPSGSGTIQGTADFSGAFAVNIDVAQIRVTRNDSNNGSAASGSITLSTAGTSNITADSMTLGFVSGGGSGTVTSALNLGGGTTNINVDTFTVGGDKAVGNVTIASGGVLNLSGNTNAAADLIIGDNAPAGGTGTNPSLSTFNLLGGTFNATLDELIIGRHGPGTGSGKGRFLMDAGTVTANSVALAVDTGSNPGNTTGTLEQRGGTFTVSGAVTDGGGVSTLYVDRGTMTIGNGLTVDDLRVGLANVGNPANASLTVNGGAVSIGTGSQTVEIGYRTANNNNNSTGTVDLTNASSVNINVASLLIGTITTGGGGNVDGNLLLSTVGGNVITANAITVSDSPAAGNTGAPPSTLVTANTTTLNVNTLIVGSRKAFGTLTALPGSTLIVRGQAGGTSRADLIVGNNIVSGTGTVSNGVVDFTGATLDVLLDELVLGRKQNNAAGSIGTLTFDTGTIDTNSVLLGDIANAGTVSGVAQGTINQNGGTLIVRGALSDDQATTSTYNLNAGTLQFITLSEVQNFNFNGGRIQNVPGQNLIDTNVAINLLTAATHTIEIDAGQLGTIPAGATITGPGSLTKAGAGTLLFSGTNDYAGQTNVINGVLQVQNGTALGDTSGAVNVGLGATFQLLSNETISSYVGAGDPGAGTNDSTLVLGGNALTVTGSAALGDVTSAGGSIVAGTSITDNDDDNNVTGTGIYLQAGSAIGSALDPIETAVANLEALAGTGVFLASTTNVTIGGVGPATGVSTTNGPIVLTSTGNLTVSENISASGAGNAVTLTTIDSGAAGQDLIINAGVTVSSAAASVTLNAGDVANLNGQITSGTTTTINIDANNADAAGGTLTLTGAITAPGGAFLNGHTNDDTFSLAPQTGAAVTINGNAPHGTPTGDVLNLDISSAVNPLLTLGGIGAGTWTFDAPLQTLQYISIEDVNANAPYHLAIDANNTPFGNTGVDDRLTLTRSGTDFVLTRTGDAIAPDNDDIGIVFQGAFATILSFSYVGSSDNDILTIDDVGGLVNFLGTVPGVGNNPNLAGTAEFFFAGNAGNDALVFNLTGNAVSQTYAIGDGSGTPATEGEVQSISGGVTLQTYFEDVESATRTGIGSAPGSLTVLGTNSADDLSMGASGTSTQIDSPGYTPFAFSGNNYSSVNINGLAGSDLLQLVGIGSGQTNASPTFLNGGDNADTLRVHSTSGNTGVVTLTGNTGDDLFQLFNAASTVDGIVGRVVVDGSDGNVGGNTDTLSIVDSGDTSGDSVLISAVNAATSADYAVEGITSTTGSDVILRNIDVLNYTGTAGNDTIDGRFVNTTPVHDLSVVSLSGWLGADQFLLFTSDQLGGSGAGVTPTGVASGVAMISLYGDAPGNPNTADGIDRFGATPPGVTGTGVMQVGLVVPDSVRLIRPSATTGIQIDGGTPTGSASPMGDSIGDVHNLDISALPNTTPVVVSTLSPGTVVAVGIAPLTWTEIEDLNLVDQGVLTNVQQGDLFARTTPGADLIQLTRNPTLTDPNRLRLRLTSSIANYSATNKTVIYGGGANDYITQANLTIPAEFYGEDGDDYLTGATNNDWLVGGLGNDRINGGAGDNVIWGDNAPTTNDPNPQDSAVGGNDTLSGLGGSDVFYGGGGDDSVSAGGGNDYAYGGQGNDLLDGNEGDDRLYGGVGNDTLSGHTGNDLLSGADGDDKLYGNGGNDVLLGGNGVDLIDGGDGNDLLVSGSVANEASSWTSVASTSTYSAATYTDGADNDAALLALLSQWGLSSNRTGIGAITHDGVNDDLWGSTGDDDFCWELADILDNLPGTTPPDYNAPGMGTDERFGPT